MSRFSAAFALSLLVGCAAPVVAATPAATPVSQDEAEADAPEKEPRPKLELYRAIYGEGTPTFVFLHGGPGYNSALFEATTADALSKHGRVVVYDRRGSGRSADVSAAPQFTFDEALADLDQVLEGLESPILLAHSFGGAVALRYLDARPDFNGTVVLVNAPISYPRSLATILANCRAVYEAKKDAQNLGFLEQIEAMDPASSQYAGLTFLHGMGCGLYRPSAPTEEAGALSKMASAHADAAYFADSKPGPFTGFHANEAYTSLDLSELVERHASRLWAVYADEDRIIDIEDRELLRRALGSRFVSVPAAAHNVFVDQQAGFLEAVAAVANR